MASIDLQSQYQLPTPWTQGLAEQITQIFEFFAGYFDCRFLEMQEFIFHFNKGVMATNKNFSTLSAARQPISLDILHPFKSRKPERTLQEELKEFLKQLLESREEYIRSSVLVPVFSQNTDKETAQNMASSRETLTSQGSDTKTLLTNRSQQVLSSDKEVKSPLKRPSHVKEHSSTSKGKDMPLQQRR